MGLSVMGYINRIESAQPYSGRQVLIKAEMIFLTDLTYEDFVSFVLKKEPIKVAFKNDREFGNSFRADFNLVVCEPDV